MSAALSFRCNAGMESGPIALFSSSLLIARLTSSTVMGRISEMVDFENIIKKVDKINYDHFLQGDINVNLMPGVTSVNATKLNDVLFQIYGLKQLITDPTGTIPYSSTPR